jgi:hypothetical protein
VGALSRPAYLDGLYHRLLTEHPDRHRELGPELPARTELTRKTKPARERPLRLDSDRSPVLGSDSDGLSGRGGRQETGRHRDRLRSVSGKVRAGISGQARRIVLHWHRASVVHYFNTIKQLR